tara:strand:+ start:856 stop:2346 length:1491 start_codon:yes stop_codon:yes gene_type:complete
MASKYFPAMKVKMGPWEYYAARISFKDLEKTFVFSKSLGKKSSLNGLLQRHLNENRATKPMRDFLTDSQERFYSSIVVANLNEQRDCWNPVILDKKELPGDLEPSERSIGYLEISDKDKYYILDGQHRAASIISIINPHSSFLQVDENEDGVEENLQERSSETKEVIKVKKLAPLSEDFNKEGFANEEIIVLVLNKRVKDQELAEQSYRRLFSSLNRYAKPTDAITNIITSEDDTFFILTRRLIDNFEYLSVEGEENALDNPNILFVSSFKGKERQFTTLDTLAKMNEWLLKANKFPRLNKQNHSINGEIRGDRQSDDDLDTWYEELEKRWQAIFNVFPEFLEDRTKMRSHDAKIGGPQSDHPYLWPIVQKQIFVKLVKELFDKENKDTKKSYEEILEPLGKLDVKDLREAPWRGMLLVPSHSGEDRLVIRQSADDQGRVIGVLLDLLRYLVGIAKFQQGDIEELKKKFLALNIELTTREDKDAFWEKCLEKKLET